MSETTKIQWATSTGNPWIGCTKVSPGCKNCYAAELDQNRFSKTMGGGTKAAPVSHWGKGAPRFRTKGFWRDAVTWNKEWRSLSSEGERPRVFPSLCDWLDEEVPIEWLADFLKLIHDTPNLDWLLLTKRPENWAKRLEEADSVLKNEALWHWRYDDTPFENVWIGVSVEDQERADVRIPAFLRIPAAIHFLSVEPLLGPVDLTYVENAGYKLNSLTGRQKDMGRPCEDAAGKIDWVIVGGESGPGARPCNVKWIRDIVRQCKISGRPSVFVKQFGSNSVGWGCDDPPGPSVRFKDKKGGDPSEWPRDLRVREFPSLERAEAAA